MGMWFDSSALRMVPSSSGLGHWPCSLTVEHMPLTHRTSGSIPTEVKFRFESKFVRKGLGECWLWTASTFNNGYGKFYLDGRTQSAHRVSYQLYVGPVTGFVLHSCDNPLCVNPAHLRCGTHEDNMRDVVVRDRAHSGVRNHNHKLTPEEVLTIREQYENGSKRQVELATEFGVDQRVISRIVRKEIWVRVLAPSSNG